MSVTSRLNKSTSRDDVDPETAPLTRVDHNRLSVVEASLARGLVIRDWWDRVNVDRGMTLDAEAVNSLLDAKLFRQSFPLMQVSASWPLDVSFGFFDRIDQDGLHLPVMGCFQQFFYDQPTLRLREALSRVPEIAPDVIDRVQEQAFNNWRDNLREFVLGTFIRATSRIRPYPHATRERGPLASYLERFSWCPEGEGPRVGMRYTQLYYKRLDTGRVGKFWPVDYPAINLRDIGTKYAWIVIEDEVSGHDLEFRLDDETPYVGVPVLEKQYGVISPEFILEDETPGDGILARYGFGYVLLKQGDSTGSDHLQPPYDFGLQQTEFWLKEDGEILVQNYLIAERPQRLSLLKLNPAGLGISAVDRVSLGLFSNILKPLAKNVERLPLVGRFDPILTYVELINALTGGFAARELCIQPEQLERQVLFNHYLKQFEMVLGTRGVWRHRRDWTSPDSGHDH